MRALDAERLTAAFDRFAKIAQLVAHCRVDRVARAGEILAHLVEHLFGRYAIPDLLAAIARPLRAFHSVAAGPLRALARVRCRAPRALARGQQRRAERTTSLRPGTQQQRDGSSNREPEQGRGQQIIVVTRLLGAPGAAGCAGPPLAIRARRPL